MSAHPLLAIPAAYHRGEHLGITSVCSAHPLVIEATLLQARDSGDMALIEATCNQVNQDGGYTGMSPAHFREFVEGICARVGFDIAKLVLGGDHLGPNPWKHLPAEEAMTNAEAMIRAYAGAGFTKLHLDTSMGCRGEPAALADQATACRAARLAAAAETHSPGADPVYVIGTEVPVPGGATHALGDLQITDPESVFQTYEVHEKAFESLRLQQAFSRVIALVVQPGVEFSHTDIVHFEAGKAQALRRTLQSFPGIVFEAHSTDYQTGDGLHNLVANGFAILKVGPSLTFALREAFYALDAVADILDGHPPSGTLMATMEEAMLSSPRHWQDHYSGNATALWLQRHFSYSDRIRYCWPMAQVEQAVSRLRQRLAERRIPHPVMKQFLPELAECEPQEDIPIRAIQNVLRRYQYACSPEARH
ncbi:MAG: class II D-tagatose-bisphosphate aldolase, non-catalytic subunit [Rhodobacteraceae bacterium]|nr:class II D-tagatose-bisphosphate aldolase, non-catalytic subunit [Paracoccaceae bacterium]